MKGKLKDHFLFHLGIVLAICIVLYTLFFIGLHRITEHGKEVVMTDVTGKDMNAAIAELNNGHFKVSIDSTYDPNMKPLAVLRQIPDSGAMVKEGRIVMLTVNMISPPSVPMPNLVSISYNSAAMMLRNNKLILGDTIWKPDVNGGMVLEQMYNGHPIKAGDNVQQGSKISLVIGNGAGNTEHNVPNLIGMSVDGARTVLNSYNIQVEIMLHDPAKKLTDTGEASVFDQLPREMNDANAPNRIKDGGKITLIVE